MNPIEQKQDPQCPLGQQIQQCETLIERSRTLSESIKRIEEDYWEERDPFERELLQCEAFVARSRDLLQLHDALPTFAVVCEKMEILLPDQSKVTFKEIPKMKDQVLVKILEALASLDKMDEDIVTAAGMENGQFHASKNVAVQQMREMLVRLDNYLRRMQFDRCPSEHPVDPRCFYYAKNFVNFDQENMGGLTTQRVGTRNGSMTRVIDSQRINNVHKAIQDNSTALLEATEAVDTFYSVLNAFQEKAKEVRTQEFARKTPAITELVEKIIRADKRGCSQRNSEEISDPIRELQELVTTTIPNQAGRDFWSSEIYRAHVRPIINRAEIRASQLYNSDVLRKHRRNSSAEHRQESESKLEWPIAMVNAEKGKQRGKLRGLFSKFLQNR